MKRNEIGVKCKKISTIFGEPDKMARVDTIIGGNPHFQLQLYFYILIRHI